LGFGRMDEGLDKRFVGEGWEREEGVVCARGGLLAERGGRRGGREEKRGGGERGARGEGGGGERGVEEKSGGWRRGFGWRKIVWSMRVMIAGYEELYLIPPT